MQLLVSKRGLKRFIIRWEMHYYAASALLYVGAVPMLVVAFPDVSNLWVSIFIFVSGLLSTIAATASAIKTNDTEE